MKELLLSAFLFTMLLVFAWPAHDAQARGLHWNFRFKPHQTTLC